MQSIFFFKLKLFRKKEVRFLANFDMSTIPHNQHTHPPLQREFYIANDDLNALKKFPSNFIKTSKYTAFDFFPKTLLFQFRRYANIYFLIIAILQSIPAISPLNPVSAIAPLVFVLALSMLREGIEDYHRHKSDKEANASPCRIYKNGKFMDDQWRNIRVGDILLVKEGDTFPCDILAISTALEGGVCFIETASLDGEKNLKPKGAPKQTHHLYNSQTGIIRLEGHVGCMLPNANLYAFEGTLGLFGYEKVILSARQLLLRGAKLKNTDWIVGTAVYTGIDTKIMRNAEPSKPKISRIEQLTNTLILAILGFQTTFCLFAAIGTFGYDEKWTYSEPFLYMPYSIGIDFIISFLSYFLLLNTMIPISLIVTLELVKLIQAYFIEQDESIRNEKKQRSTKVMTSSINEELGMVEYIFSDKTGTLTCNEMQFKLAVIGNDTYGDKSILRPAREVTRLASMKLQDPEKTSTSVQFTTFKDDRLQHLLHQGVDNFTETLNMASMEKYTVNYRISTRLQLVTEYLTILATCHECMIDYVGGVPKYQGPSPDEITLVEAAASCDFIFLGGSEHSRKVKILGTEQIIEILHLFEFNSDRKRMSIIARGPDGIIKLYTKGADSIIQARLAPFGDQPYLEHNQKQLKKFSKKGLRTLMIAMRIIDPTEYTHIRARFDQISHLPHKEIEIMKLGEEIETNLYLLGSTAVEDRLQDNVPQTIFDFLQASKEHWLLIQKLEIKVWMLTGDKLETATNIAKSCNLIQPGFQVLELSEKTQNEVRESLIMHRKRYDYFTENKIPKAFIVEGESLGLAITLEDKLLKCLLLSIVKGCEAVVCCRVTPKQKAEVVRLIKNSMGKVTLAIGDGANDVNMIQEAHIGISSVGIYGNEGMRAVQASDFAIPEFQCLWRLLFVHGRWSYIRIAEMILYFFYKNMVFTIPEFYYGFICAFTARAAFDDYYITFYNMIFTALPLAIRALTDQDVNYKFLRKHGDHYEVEKRPLIRKHLPKLYYVGQKNKIFTIKKFVFSILEGLVHGALIFIICLYGIADKIIDSSGRTSDFWVFSITFFTCVIFVNQTTNMIIQVVDLKLALVTNYWTNLLAISLIILSLGIYLAYMWIADNFTSFLDYKTVSMVYSNIQFYMCLFLSMGVVYFFDLMIKHYYSQYKMSITDYFKNLIKKKKENEEKWFKDLDPKQEIQNNPQISVLPMLNQNPDFNQELRVNDEEKVVLEPNASSYHSMKY